MTELMKTECPDAAYHGKPFRYCPTKGCGWVEEPEDAAKVELTLEEKVDYLFTQAKALEALVEQAGPLLEQAGPMLESLAPMLGGLGARASSPMGRIFGAML